MILGRILAAPFRAVQVVAKGVADTFDGEPRKARPGRAPSKPRRRGVDPRAAVLRRLQSRRAGARARAAREAADMRLVAAVEPLASLARERNVEVRRAAMASLLVLDPGRFAEVAMELAAGGGRQRLFADFDETVDRLRRVGREGAATS